MGHGRLTVIVTLALLAGTCGDSRPETHQWVPEWHSMQAILPDLGTLGPESEAVCREVLANLRDDQDSIFPTPDSSVDDPAKRWVEMAKATFFECPPTGEIDGFPEAYERLQRIKDEINAALEIDPG